jgi:hypothetical protein
MLRKIWFKKYRNSTVSVEELERDVLHTALGVLPSRKHNAASFKIPTKQFYPYL